MQSMLKIPLFEDIILKNIKYWEIKEDVHHNSWRLNKQNVIFTSNKNVKCLTGNVQVIVTLPA